jgi:hypothetical protein
MKNQAKTKANKCPYCTPANPENQCVLATAKTVIDGKEYSACCSNLNTTETKNQKATKTPEK